MKQVLGGIQGMYLVRHIFANLAIRTTRFYYLIQLSN